MLARTRSWLAASLALVLAATSYAVAPTTLPSTRPASDTAPAEFASPGDVSKATHVHAATAEELNQIADRVEAAAKEMDNRRYALHVRYFPRPQEDSPLAMGEKRHGRVPRRQPAVRSLAHA